MTELTPRERVLCALNHEEPDRVPVFFGTSGVTSMLAPAYDRLKQHLGVTKPSALLSRPFQYALLDEEVMQRFGSDGRPLLQGPAPSSLRCELPDGAFVDEWGVSWRREPHSSYFEVAHAPLRDATMDDVTSYPWPELAHPSRVDGLAARARSLREETGCAVVALSGASPFEQISLLRGMERWMEDLVTRRDFAAWLLAKVSDMMLSSVRNLITAAGEYIDVVVMGDDLGTQTSLLISPRMYRRMLKEHHASLIAAVKSASSARIFFHSDGNIYPLLGDLIEIGVDIINPVQVTAGEMGDTARLKKEFGHHLSFCGGVDTGQVLPYGSPDDVRREVRRRIADLGTGGGYILAPVHCIQPDVPIQNICTLFDEAQLAGRYPLQIMPVARGGNFA